MKRLALLCLLLCPPWGVCFPAELSPPEPLPQESRYGFTLSTAAGIFYGQGEEAVYKDSSQKRLLSQLLWDLKPLFYLETGLEFSRLRLQEEPGFLAKLTVQLGLPLESGIMEDRDWLNQREDFLTNYSRHDAYANGMYSIDFRGGVSLPLTSRLLFKAYLGFSARYFEWTARDGYYQYSENGEPWNGSLKKYSVTGAGIIYSQHWIAFFPAAALGSSLGKRFSWELDCAISPLLYGWALDDHLLREKPVQYYETFNFFKGDLLGGFFLECGGNIGFALSPALTLALSAAWRTARSQKTEASNRATGAGQDGKFYLTSAGGAAYSFLEAGLSLKVRL